MTNYNPKEVNELVKKLKFFATDFGFYALLMFSFIATMAMLIYSGIVR